MDADPPPSRSTIPRRFTHQPLLRLAAGFVLVFFLHILETLVWAGAYVALGAIGALEDALYFSIVSFTTVGYGDLVLPPDWRIFGVCEGR